jgi:cobalt-zinc-cadmium efflux system outer membrane protein
MNLPSKSRAPAGRPGAIVLRLLLAVPLAAALAPPAALAQTGGGYGAAGTTGAPAPLPRDAMSGDPGATGRPSYTLSQLVERALRESPALAASRAEETAARAGISTARAYPNPELLVMPGRYSGRGTGESGNAALYEIGQPIESPWLREARRRSAESRVDLAVTQTGALQTALAAEIRRRFFDVVRILEEVQALQENLRLTEQIRERIDVRARTGEAARFDLLRAEGDVAIVRRDLEAARLQARRAAIELRRLVSPALEENFEPRVEPADQRPLTETDYLALRETLVERNPEVALARRELARAERQVELERQLILPQVTLRAAQERDPTAVYNRVGAQLTVPLVNRREGPIAEARAQVERARLTLDQRRFEALTGYDAAWQAYRAASATVQAIEGGILDRARSVLAIAEAAYRLGERGILEYLDAQRQFRLVRNDLIAARYAQQAARSELERIAGR